MEWLVHVNAALGLGAKLLADHREKLEAAGVLGQFELLLARLDSAVAYGAVASSKAKDPPVSEVFDNWGDPSYRYSPPDTV